MKPLQRRRGSLDRASQARPASEGGRACIYLRVSTDEQQLSLASQEETLLRFAAEHHIEVDAVYKDVGVSACKKDFDTRPSARRMLKDMRQSRTATILILRIDRAFRSVADCYRTMADLQRQGVYFRFVDPDLDFTSPMGKACTSLMVAFAEFEADLRAQRQYAAFDQLRAQRRIRNNNPPYGWDAVPDDTLKTRAGKPTYRLVPNLREQDVLRHILALHDESGLSMNAIAAHLNARAVPTKKAGQLRTLPDGSRVPVKGRWLMLTVKSVLEHADLASPAELQAARQSAA